MTTPDDFPAESLSTRAERLEWIDRELDGLIDTHFPATSMAETEAEWDDWRRPSTAVPWLAVAAFVIVVAAFVGIGWFIGRTRGAW